TFGAAGAWLVPIRTTGAQQTGSAPGTGDAQLLEDLVAANRILAQHSIVDAWGHVSVRSRQVTNRYFLSRSLAPAIVTLAEMIEAVVAHWPWPLEAGRRLSCAAMARLSSVRPFPSPWVAVSTWT